MHILIIPSWYPRNADDIRGSFFREQAIALRKSGCKVGVISADLISLRNWRSIFSNSNVIAAEMDDGVSTYRSHGMNWFPRTVSPTSRLFVGHGRRLYERYFAEQGIPDVIHVHSMLYAGLIATEILERYGIPYVVTEHSTAFARNLVSSKQLKLAKGVSQSASKRLAVSIKFAELLNRLLDSEMQPWQEMPNIVNERFCSYVLPPRGQRKYFEFINVAMMDKKKSQANIVRAFATIHRHHNDVRLTFVGDGPERSQLEKLAIELGVTASVKFAGLMTRAQVLEAMANADAFVLSSQFETFGVVVIEALALGKPVIATRCGGPETILRKEDGILIPVGDVGALTSSMQELLERCNEYDPEEIRNACIARYGESAIAARLSHVYLEVLSSVPPVRGKLSHANSISA